jgi:hypothetical protein
MCYISFKWTLVSLLQDVIFPFPAMQPCRRQEALVASSARIQLSIVCIRSAIAYKYLALVLGLVERQTIYWVPLLCSFLFARLLIILLDRPTPIRSPCGGAGVHRTNPMALPRSSPISPCSLVLFSPLQIRDLPLSGYGTLGFTDYFVRPPPSPTLCTLDPCQQIK